MTTEQPMSVSQLTAKMRELMSQKGKPNLSQRRGERREAFMALGEVEDRFLRAVIKLYDLAIDGEPQALALVMKYNLGDKIEIENTGEPITLRFVNLPNAYAHRPSDPVRGSGSDSE